MRIAYFLNFYPTESQVVAEKEALKLMESGHEIFIYSVWNQGSIDSRIPAELRDKLIRIPTKFNAAVLMVAVSSFIRSPLKFTRFIQRSRKYIGFVLALISVHTALTLKDFAIDRIHAHFASTNAIRGMLIADFLKIPFSCTGHGSDILLYPQTCLAEIIQNSKPFITISDYNKAYLQREYGEISDSIQVVRCGVDLCEFKPGKRKSNEIPSILSVTWLRKAKGVKYLIEAIEILKSRGFNFKSIIVGGGYLTQEIQSLITDKNLDSDVKLKGPLPHEAVIEMYNVADIFVLPSLSEGIPIALMEAMAMELPVIATDITGIPELVDDGKNGFLVRPGKPGEIAEQIDLLLNDEILRKQMGIKGREKVEQRFSLDRNAGQVEKLFCNTF